MPRGGAPLVSAIIIFLNEERYLSEAIESVLAQSYGNWELILVDDGSTDGSEAIARSYAERSPDKIRYVTHDGRANRGMSASRNLGLREARGAYAGFLDGDDYWYPDKLERQLAIFAAQPRAIMVCGATQYWHDWQAGAPRANQTLLVGQWSGNDGTVAQTLEQDRLYEAGELIRRLYPIGKGATPSSSGNLFLREVALALGGYDESFRGLFEDQVFRAKVYLHGPIYVSAALFDRYRQHDDSCYYVSKATGQSNKARLCYLTWLRTYLDQVRYRDAFVRRRVRQLTLRYKHPRLHRLWSQLMAKARRKSFRRAAPPSAGKRFVPVGQDSTG